MNSPAPVPTHNTPNIDLLRGSAAMIVVISHFHGVKGISFGWLGVQGGWLGVQLFFVISGYLIIQSAYKYSAREYFIHRFFRIFPAYWFWYLFMGLASGALAASAWLDPYFYANLVLLQHFIPEAYLRYTFINPSWTLSVEWGWYVVAFLLALTSRRLMLVYFVLSVLIATWWVYGGSAIHPLAGTLGDPVYEYFFIGNMLIAQLPFFMIGCIIYFYRPRLPMALVLLVSIALLATYTQWVNRFANPIVFTGIAVGGIFWAFVNTQRTFHGPIVRFLSDTSYSIYLIHYPVIAFVSSRLDNKYAIMLVSLVMVFTLAYLSYRFIEKPCMQWGRRLGKRYALTPS